MQWTDRSMTAKYYAKESGNTTCLGKRTSGPKRRLKAPFCKVLKSKPQKQSCLFGEQPLMSLKA